MANMNNTELHTRVAEMGQEAETLKKEILQKVARRYSHLLNYNSLDLVVPHR